jgi:hypothetical protein
MFQYLFAIFLDDNHGRAYEEMVQILFKWVQVVQWIRVGLNRASAGQDLGPVTVPSHDVTTLIFGWGAACQMIGCTLL